MQPVFAIHGCPSLLISDNATNFCSGEFTKFTTEWDFEHITSSTYHSQSNGKAEAAVKVCKSRRLQRQIQIYGRQY